MRIFTVVALLLCLSLAPHATPLEDKQVPKAVRIAFKHKYPKQKATWEKITNFYSADFIKDSIERQVSFEKDGSWAFTHTVISLDKIPTAVMATLSSAEYSKWPILKTTFIETTEHGNYYCLVYSDGHKQVTAILFPDGNLLNKTEVDVNLLP